MSYHIMKCMGQLKDHQQLGELYPVVLPFVLVNHYCTTAGVCLICSVSTHEQGQKRKGSVAVGCTLIASQCVECIALEPLTFPAGPASRSC